MSDIPPRRIYISAPMDRTLNADQLATKHSILTALHDENLEPQQFFVSGLPQGWGWNFDRASDLMCRCDGALVIALARWRPTLNSGETIAMPSEYNHFEGALAVAHKVPLLIVAEVGLMDRGITWMGGGYGIAFISAGTNWKNTSMQRQFEVWRKEVIERPRVFVGYCGKAKSIADSLTLFLERELRVPSRSYAMDFIGGSSILEEIERASRECAVGIFLFTKDDPLVGFDEHHAAPRDNVIFEAGYFIKARGKERTLIIRESGAKMPADLGGVIYLNLQNREDISSLHTPIRQFLKNRL